MSKTIRVSNGDIYINESLGQLLYIDGLEKAAQDVARHLLSELSTFFDEGNELLTNGVGEVGTFAETLAQQYLTEAINRLIAKQAITETSGRIVKVNDVRTRIIGLSTLIFMVEVLYEDGQVTSVTSKVDLKTTALDHTINYNSFSSV